MKREFRIGLFALIILLSLWAAVRFLSGIDIFSRSRTYYADYAQINGLQPASPVMVNGYKIGTVSGIEFDPIYNRRVVLRLSINRRYRIPANSEARIYSNGLMGGKAIDIALGDTSVYLSPGDTLRTVADPDFMQRAGSELEFFKQKVTAVVDDLTRTLGTLNALMEANASHVTHSMQHVEGITGHLDEMLDRETGSIRRMISSLEEVTGTLASNTPRIDSILRHTETFSRQLAEARVDDVALSLRSTLTEMDGMLHRLNAGEGSLGQLVRNPALYDSLSRATGNLSALLSDLKAHPKRYVHFSLFGSNPDKKQERQEARETRREERANRRGND